MSNFVFYDFETSSSNKQWGQIIEMGAILVDDQLNELKDLILKQMKFKKESHHLELGDTGSTKNLSKTGG